MKKQYAIVAFLFLHSHQLHCMKNNDVPINIKLDDKKIYEITLNTIRVSNTIYEKCLWQEQLAIDSSKSIIVPHITHEQLNLFAQAACTAEKNFKSFFSGLTKEQQKTLMSISGKKKIKLSSSNCAHYSGVSTA